MHQHQHGHHDQGSSHGHLHMFESPEMAADVELEGEVLAGFVTEAVAELAECCVQHEVDVLRVLDLGSGPGIGTCALAEQFPSAVVVAVDGSAAMLDRVTANARRRGLSDRTETRQVDLTDGVASLGPCDVVWASMSLHHVGDETAALAGIRGLLEQRGLLAIIERADPLRIQFDDDDLGRPGIWDRLDAAWTDWYGRMRADLPGAATSGSYPSMLAAAGFELLVDRTLTLALDAPLAADARRFAHRHVRQTCSRLDGYADPDDLAAIATLVEDTAGGVGDRWSTGALRATRHLYIARPTP